jgi:hypothetical protein
MSNSTFSGPLRAGTQKDPAPFSNVGWVSLCQVTTIPAADIRTAAVATVVARLPAGAKILEFTVEKTVAIATATEVGVTFGVQGGSATQYSTTFNTGVALGKVATATADTAQVVQNTNNVGTADVAVTCTPTAVTGNASAGNLVITTRYLQRNADGS